MRKVFQRLLVFFIGLPIVIGLVFFDQFHHLALHILILGVTFLASGELFNLLSKKFALQKKSLVLSMSCIPPVIGTFCAIFNLHTTFIDYGFLAAVMICMGIEALTIKIFTDSVSRLLTSSFIILYTGFFITFVSRMTLLQYSQVYISLFLLMVFMCDSLAWLFGNLFGKNNKGFIKSSPNKSIAGFIGGFFGSILCGIINYYLFRDIFTGSITKVVFLGFLIALFAIIGDLVESVIKRSVDIKDSGSIIPGRGGLLDSIDSIVFAAPVFYFGINILYI